MSASKAGLFSSLAPPRLAKRLLQRIPEPLKAPIRDSKLWSELRTPWHARKLASTTRRLDLSAAQFAHMLHLSGLRVEGKSCLELGAGWVLTHALTCHLLGAARVVAVDVDPLARAEAIGHAVRSASPALIRDVLAPFSNHGDIRARLDRLLAIKRFDSAVLSELGIHYIAPIDLSRKPLPERFHFIYSLSVLEHVPLAAVQPLLANLASQLAPGGAMLHAIHLEDHLDSARAPFAFLAQREKPFEPAEQTQRGNRMRASSWLAAFSEQSGLEHDVLWSWERRDRPLPDPIDPAVRYENETDLRTSHLGIVARLRS